MNGPLHFQAAEKLLRAAKGDHVVDSLHLEVRAVAHAVLALAAAMAPTDIARSETELRAWRSATGYFNGPNTIPQEDAP